MPVRREKRPLVHRSHSTRTSFFESGPDDSEWVEQQIGYIKHNAASGRRSLEHHPTQHYASFHPEPRKPRNPGTPFLSRFTPSASGGRTRRKCPRRSPDRDAGADADPQATYTSYSSGTQLAIQVCRRSTRTFPPPLHSTPLQVVDTTLNTGNSLDSELRWDVASSQRSTSTNVYDCQCCAEVVY